MRTVNKVLIGSLLVLVTIGYFPLISAATTQWFPSEGSVSEYTFSIAYTLPNGTMIESNKFDLYNQSGTYFMIPSINKIYFQEQSHPTWTLKANETEVKLQYRYTEHDITQWERAPTIIWGNNFQTTYTSLATYYYSDFLGEALRWFSGLLDIVYKSNFFTTLQTGAFVDYFDSTKGIGCDIAPYNESIIAKTPDYIIAFKVGTTTNITIIASRDGRVQSLILLKEGTSPMVTRGIHTIALILTLSKTETSGIPSFPLVLTLVGIISSILLFKMAKKYELF